MQRALPILAGFLAVGGGAAGFAGHASASPLEEFGFGGRSSAMGGVGAASSEDFESVYSNPAGLGDLTQKRFSAGFLFGSFNLNGVDRTVDNAEGLIVGVTLPVPFEDFLKNRVGFGFGVYVPTQQLNRVRSPTPGTPYFALLEDRQEVIGIQVGLGIKLSDRWSFGAGLLVLAALQGEIDVSTDTAGRFDTISQEQLIANYAPVAGIRYRASDALTLGAVFHQKSESSYNLVVNTDLGNVLPIKLPVIRIAGVAQYDPLFVAAEAAWHVTPMLLLSAQVGWEHWSAYPQPTLDPLDFVTPPAATNFHDNRRSPRRRRVEASLAGRRRRAARRLFPGALAGSRGDRQRGPPRQHPPCLHRGHRLLDGRDRRAGPHRRVLPGAHPATAPLGGARHRHLGEHSHRRRRDGGGPVKPVIFGLSAVLAASFVARSAHANPIDVLGFGARAAAMGGAQTAATEDTGANYYNPGAIADGDLIKVDIGYQLGLPSLSINGQNQGVDAIHGLDIGLIVPGDFGKIHVAFGLGIFLPDDRLIRIRTLPSDTPRWMYYDNRPQRFFLGTNIAVRIGDSLFLGAGVGYMSRTSGTATLVGRVGYPDENDSQLALGIDVSLLSLRYPEAGILWKPNPWLNVGLTYRGGVVLQIQQGVTIMGDLGPAALPVVQDAFFKLNTMALDLFQPTEIAAGFAAHLTPRLLVSGDLTWAKWSDFQNPAAQIVLDYDLKQFNSLVNIPGALPLEPAYFHDIFIPRIGVEYTASRKAHAIWTLRAGYSFEPTPTPEQQGETNFVDSDKHTLSAGIGLELSHVTKVLPHPFNIDLYVAGTLLPEIETHKLSPVDPVGDYTAKGTVLAAGIMTRWKL